MVRTRPCRRDLVSHEEYLRLAMTSPMNNCPGGIGPILRKRYAMEQRAKKEEAALREKLAKMALADANRPPLSEKAQRRKEKRKMGRINKKKKENMDSEISETTPDEKLDTESKTPNEQQQPFIGPEYCPPALAKNLEKAAVLIKELEAGNDTFEIVTALVVVENIIEKISLHYKASCLFPRDWTYNRATPRDYSALRSKYRMSY